MEDFNEILDKQKSTQVVLNVTAYDISRLLNLLYQASHEIEGQLEDAGISEGRKTVVKNEQSECNEWIDKFTQILAGAM